MAVSGNLKDKHETLTQGSVKTTNTSEKTNHKNVSIVQKTKLRNRSDPNKKPLYQLPVGDVNNLLTLLTNERKVKKLRTRVNFVCPKCLITTTPSFNLSVLTVPIRTRHYRFTTMLLINLNVISTNDDPSIMGTDAHQQGLS